MTNFPNTPDGQRALVEHMLREIAALRASYETLAREVVDRNGALEREFQHQLSALREEIAALRIELVRQTMPNRLRLNLLWAAGIAITAIVAGEMGRLIIQSLLALP